MSKLPRLIPPNVDDKLGPRWRERVRPFVVTRRRSLVPHVKGTIRPVASSEPIPLTNEMVLMAANTALTEMKPSGTPLVSLDDGAQSNSEWPCVAFGGAMLEAMQTSSKGEGCSTEYQQDLTLWPSEFPPGSFVHFSMTFNESAWNHVFDVYFESDLRCYLFQTFLGFSVRISTPRAPSEFMQQWKKLATPDWAIAYQTLFSVEPDATDNAYQSQWVTVLGPF